LIVPLLIAGGNPSVLDANTPAVDATLGRFETLFKALNGLLA
jgi:hypothetical protein